MNLHQLRFVREAVRQNYNLTDAAKALFTSQPGVSKAIIELEEELGVDIFTRHADIEEGEIRLQFIDQFDGFFAVFGFAEDLKLRPDLL